MGAVVRLVQLGRWAETLGWVEMLRPGETTRGTPDAEIEVMRVVRDRIVSVVLLDLCILWG